MLFKANRYYIDKVDLDDSKKDKRKQWFIYNPQRAISNRGNQVPTNVFDNVMVKLSTFN